MSEEVNGVLHCTAFGDLLPSDICENCDDCKWNHEFADQGGYPAMLLSGSRENLAVALRQPGVPMEDVVVVNAKRFKKMEKALKEIAAMEPGEHTEEFSSMRDITVDCYRCCDMIDIAKEALGGSDDN